MSVTQQQCGLLSSVFTVRVLGPLSSAELLELEPGNLLEQSADVVGVRAVRSRFTCVELS